jgi:flagellar biosynthetic protein FliR
MMATPSLDISLLPELAWLALLLFARLGTLFLLMPGIGETTVPVRVRLVLALATLLVVYPTVSGVLPRCRKARWRCSASSSGKS